MYMTLVLSGLVSWNDANETCVKQGYSLVTFSSPEILDHFVYFLSGRYVRWTVLLRGPIAIGLRQNLQVSI